MLFFVMSKITYPNSLQILKNTWRVQIYFAQYVFQTYVVYTLQNSCRTRPEHMLFYFEHLQCMCSSTYYRNVFYNFKCAKSTHQKYPGCVLDNVQCITGKDVSSSRSENFLSYATILFLLLNSILTKNWTRAENTYILIFQKTVKTFKELLIFIYLAYIYRLQRSSKVLMEYNLSLRCGRNCV